MMDRQAEIEACYQALVDMYEKAVQIHDDMKPIFHYSPFDHMPWKIKTELESIRRALIERVVTHLNRIHMPNATPDCNFVELMNNEAGECGFKISVLESWFKHQAHDQTVLGQISKQQLIKKSALLRSLSSQRPTLRTSAESAQSCRQKCADTTSIHLARRQRLCASESELQLE